jgi:hypothetical protein
MKISRHECKKQILVGVVLGSYLISGVQALDVPPPGSQLLNNLYSCKTGTDYFSSITNAENQYYNDGNGIIFYLPATNPGNGVAWYRLNKNGDHMDSTSTNEAGYTSEGQLGYLYSTQVAGTSAVWRSESAAGDHCTQTPSQVIAGYNPAVKYTNYAYARYFATAAKKITTLTYNGTEVVSRNTAGGAVWSWTYNGVQYINNRDIGRYLQCAVLAPMVDPNSATTGYSDINPTEGGDLFSNPNWAENMWHGSPVLSSTNSNDSSGKARIQSTNCTPLEWNSDVYGGSFDKPIVWKDWKIGKKITLNYKNRTDMKNVATYETMVYTPTAIKDAVHPAAGWETTGPWDLNAFGFPPHSYVYTNASGVKMVENKATMGTALYLRPTFRYFYTYETTASSSPVNTLTRVYPPQSASVYGPYKCTPFTPTSGFGGAIAADGTSSTSNAIGLYGVRTSSGGSLSFFSLWDYTNLNSSESLNSALSTTDNCTMLGAEYVTPDRASVGTQLLAPQATKVLTYWVITGTLAEVQEGMNKMRENYVNGDANALGPIKSSFSNSGSW